MQLLKGLAYRLNSINFAQRLMLTIGGYTFAIMLVLMLGLWIFIEANETDDNLELATSFQNAVATLNQAPSTTQSTFIHTPNFDLYLDQEKLPDRYKPLTNKLGYTLLDDGSALYVGDNPNTNIPYYLLFDYEADKSLIEDEFDDILFVISAVILSTMLTLLMVRFMSKQLAAPIIELKEQVEAYEVGDKPFPLMDRDDEIGLLNHAFSDLITRMRDFTKREQDFTRFASHELRSPITIIKGNLDILQENLPKDSVYPRLLKRMDNAVQRVSLLIDGFLWLGREKEISHEMIETIDSEQVARLVDSLLEHASAEQRARLTININDVHWKVPTVLLSIILDNLLRNALQHSDQPVTLIAQANHLSVSNPIGNPTDAEQLGIGLQIVNRICETSLWDYNISQDDSHFTCSITFSRCS